MVCAVALRQQQEVSMKARVVVLAVALLIPTIALSQSLVIMTPEEFLQICTTGVSGVGNEKHNQLFKECRLKLMSDPNVIVISGKFVGEDTKRLIGEYLRARLAEKRK